MRSISLIGKQRDQVGKSSAIALRKSGHIPCVVYGGSETTHFSLDLNTANKIVFTPAFFRCDIEVNGKIHPSIIKELQFHKLNDSIQHIDFLELVDTKKVICDIPLKITGQAKGLREGGKLLVKIRKIKVKGYPKDLRETIDVNIDHLELGKSVKIGDIKIEGLEILLNPSIPVASIEVTRALKSAATEAAKTDAKSKK